MRGRRALLLLALAGPASAQPIAGAEALPGGGWTLAFPPDAEAPDAAQRAALAEIARRLAPTQGRVTLWSEVAAGEDLSATRRLALRRARAAREALVAAGLAGTRIDLRAVGVTAARRDALDILPPGVTRD